MERKHLLFIYHSLKGHTELLIQKCIEGASKENVEIKVQKALDATLDDILWADGIVLGTPEYFGSMSGGLKDFSTEPTPPARALAINKPYTLLISCETDGTGAERQVQSITPSYTLKKALDTIIVKESEQAEKLSAIEELGQTFAAGIDLGIF